MGFRFVCPSTGHRIETALEVDDENLLRFRTQGIGTQCSFCGGSHEWVFIVSEQGEERKSRRRSLRS
jgi:hypothetical protein